MRIEGGYQHFETREDKTGYTVQKGDQWRFAGGQDIWFNLSEYEVGNPANTSDIYIYRRPCKPTEAYHFL